VWWNQIDQQIEISNFQWDLLKLAAGYDGLVI